MTEITTQRNLLHYKLQHRQFITRKYAHDVSMRAIKLTSKLVQYTH